MVMLIMLGSVLYANEIESMCIPTYMETENDLRYDFTKKDRDNIGLFKITYNIDNGVINDGEIDFKYVYSVKNNYIFEFKNKKNSQYIIIDKGITERKKDDGFLLKLMKENKNTDKFKKFYFYCKITKKVK